MKKEGLKQKKEEQKNSKAQEGQAKRKSMEVVYNKQVIDQKEMDEY